MGLKSILVAFATVSLSISAVAADSQTTTKTKDIRDFFRGQSYELSVDTTFGTGEVLEESQDVFTMTPTMDTAHGKVNATYSVPFIWTEGHKDDAEPSRAIGRPTAQYLVPMKRTKDLKLSMGTIVKLPMYSGSQESMAINKVWTFEPMAKVRNRMSARTDLITVTSLDFTGAGDAFYNDPSAGRIRINLDRAPTFKIASAMTYRYDSKLTMGVNARWSSALSKHKLEAKQLGAAAFQTVNEAGRDRLNIGVFSSFKMSNNRMIQASISSALKDEDTVAGSLVAIDELDKTSRLSASVGMSQTF